MSSFPFSFSSDPFLTHMDLYQLTSLIPHWDHGLGQQNVWMSFFSRRLPRTLQGQTARDVILWAGLRKCLEWLKDASFDESRLNTLLAHPMLGPALLKRPDCLEALRNWTFKGEVWSPQEGELIWADLAQDKEGNRLDFDGIIPSAQTPYLQIKTDLLTAKLIETPLLSIINHMTMVASKAARIVLQAGDRPVFEFGSRRTHIEAAVDAAYAAYLAGCSGTSNLEAHHRYGVPVVGTMDHFAIQAWEEPEKSKAQTEYAFFEAFYQAYPEHASLLVDTYDTFGHETGIRNAVRATQGKLSGIRIDSQITAENMHKARTLLDELGAPHARIIVSGGMDEHSIADLHHAPVDAFGVGERLVTSADAPVGVGAVGKLSRIGDRFTMKQAKGSAKATLPGPLQVYRGPKGDRVALLGQSHTQPEERALIQRVWTEEAGALDLPSIEETRDRVQNQLDFYTYIEQGQKKLKNQRVYVDSTVIQAIHHCLNV